MPDRIITKPPTAELRPNQKDEDSLPPYSLLDRILEGLVDKELSVNEVANATGQDVALVADIESKLLKAEYAGDPTFRRTARVRSLTPELAKGLEFDLVVLVDPDAFGTGIEGAVDHYVAMTRATQRLVILTSS